jgi:hypothetical protein
MIETRQFLKQAKEMTKDTLMKMQTKYEAKDQN